MRGRSFLLTGMLICLLASSAPAEERKKSKQTDDPGNGQKTEQSLSRTKDKKPQSLTTKPAAKKSTPPPAKRSETRSTVTKRKAPSTQKTDDPKAKEKGLLPSLKKIFNGTNDYFIDKNGDGVSDWWEKRKRVKVQPRPPEKRTDGQRNEKTEKKPRRR